MTDTQTKLLIDALKQLEGVKKLIREILDVGRTTEGERG